MGGSSSPAADTTNVQTIRYADYIETYHQLFLANSYWAGQAAVVYNPYYAISNIVMDNIFLGVGYTLSNYTPLFSVFNDYLLNVDINNLWTTVFSDTVSSTIVKDLVNAESALLDDEILIKSIPRYQTGNRDINSVMSSSFITGKALIEDAKVKALAKFSAELKYRLIPVATDRWKTTLEWNRGIVGLYSEMIKFYFSTKLDVEDHNEALSAKRILWPFTVYEFVRAAIGTLQGATTTKTDVAGASTASKVIGGALSGAAMGATIGSTFNTAAAPATATTPAVAASSAGSMWGAGLGAVAGIAAAYTY